MMTDWRTVRDNCINLGTDWRMRIIFDDVTGRDVAYVDPNADVDNGNQAAALIAAAPRLHRLCRRALWELWKLDPGLPIVRSLEEAIASVPALEDPIDNHDRIVMRLAERN